MRPQANPAPHTVEIVTTRFEEDELARIDQLAKQRGVTRDVMLARLAVRGIALEEPPLRTPSPGSGWALLGFVAVMLALGGWWIVHVIDARLACLPAPTTAQPSAHPPRPTPPPRPATEIRTPPGDP